MAPTPLISIITPVYNGEKYIAETIDSVLNASINIPFEYLVLNDGSTDSTLTVLKTFGDKIRLISHKNMGESATVNRGLENSSGKFVLIVSADDPLLTGDLINQAVKILENKDSVVALYPDWRIIGESGELLKINILPEYSDEIMVGRCRCLPGPGVVFRRDSALKIGGRRSKWKFVGDYDFWLRLSREGTIERLPGVLAQWRNNSGSTSVSQRGEKMASERIEVIEDFIDKNDITAELARKALGNAHYLAARLAFFDSSIDGRRLLIRSFKLRHKWPEEAKIYVAIFLLLMPLSTEFISLFLRVRNRLMTH
jgi:glycosyltransferase involved in cell wall biosynthesis